MQIWVVGRVPDKIAPKKTIVFGSGSGTNGPFYSRTTDHLPKICMCFFGQRCKKCVSISNVTSSLRQSWNSIQAARTIFYGWRIPTGVFLPCRREKIKNKNSWPADVGRKKNKRDKLTDSPITFTENDHFSGEIESGFQHVGGNKSWNGYFFFLSDTIPAHRRARHPQNIVQAASWPNLQNTQHKK